jgi:hypothetical protein
MIGSLSDNNDRLDRFKDAIRQKWNCDTNYIREADCDLSPFVKGMVSAFVLLGQLKQYPEAKQCFVWDSKDFRQGDNEVIIVFDVQVISDAKDLPRLAVWAWLTDTLIKDPDIYVESKKWTKDQLHRFRVGFGPHFEITRRFFVRERADGKIAVRIVKPIQKELNGKRDDADTSVFCLTQSDVERIEPTPHDSYPFKLLSFS